jgi:hypothetical protein
MQCILYKIYFWKGFSYVLQIDMHFIRTPMWTKNFILVKSGSYNSLFRLKLCNRIRNLNYNKVQLLEHFMYNLRVCDVLCIITLVMAPCNDPG